jgi:hypothetical protein
VLDEEVSDCLSKDEFADEPELGTDHASELTLREAPQAFAKMGSSISIRPS